MEMLACVMKPERKEEKRAKGPTFQRQHTVISELTSRFSPKNNWTNCSGSL